jgi:hypothetical protein
MPVTASSQAGLRSGQQQNPSQRPSLQYSGASYYEGSGEGRSAETSQEDEKKPKFNIMDYVRPDLPRKIVEDVKEAFDYIDVNGSGSIDFFEIKKAIIDLGLDGRNEMIKEIFWRLDEDMSSVLEFKEFLEMMTTTMILGNDLTKFKNYFLYRKVIS